MKVMLQSWKRSEKCVIKFDTQQKSSRYTYKVKKHNVHESADKVFFFIEKFLYHVLNNFLCVMQKKNVVIEQSKTLFSIFSGGEV